MEILIPLFGISVGIIVPLAVFYWQYHETKQKNETIIEISKNIDDPSKLEDLLGMLDERKKEPIDYRRTGVVTLFTGVGLFLFGVFFLGSILKGVGELVAAIGLAATAVSVFANNNSTHENIKQRNIVTPIPATIVGTKIFIKNLQKEYPST